MAFTDGAITYEDMPAASKHANTMIATILLLNSLTTRYAVSFRIHDLRLRFERHLTRNSLAQIPIEVVQLIDFTVHA
jgi:hypothetical protein